MIFSENRLPPTDQVRGHAFPDNALAAALTAGEGIGLAPQHQTDWRARQREILAHLVDEVTPISLRQLTGARRKQYEGWRPGFRLGDIIEAELAAADCRRRIGRDR